ncbi:unnamed protein product [Arabis nemorensis]|uniref:RRM domain-containing protein n=1 Tax=Arabis nemorensis TaxID=586526 RepID=A0A565BE85_9BRAS|nr:unnamed protein product [Arabis nemorensis]
MRDPDTGNSRGSISYDSFEASDAAIEAMTGQYLCNRQITVSYSLLFEFAERLLAATNRPDKQAPYALRNWPANTSQYSSS